MKRKRKNKPKINKKRMKRNNKKLNLSHKTLRNLMKKQPQKTVKVLHRLIARRIKRNKKARAKSKIIRNKR